MVQTQRVVGEVIRHGSAVLGFTCVIVIVVVDLGTIPGRIAVAVPHGTEPRNLPTGMDLNTLWMFSQTGAPQKGSHKPQNVRQQCIAVYPVRASLWQVALLKL